MPSAWSIVNDDLPVFLITVMERKIIKVATLALADDGTAWIPVPGDDGKQVWQRLPALPPATGMNEETTAGSASVTSDSAGTRTPTNGWQPGETAPRDGSGLLGCIRGNRNVWLIKWGRYEHKFCWRIETVDQTSYADDEDLLVWMPLPALPGNLSDFA
jgi:hypothetical protein